MKKIVLLLTSIISILIVGALVFGGTTYIYENVAVIGLDTDGTLAANSDARVPSQKAVKTYADTMQPLDADLTAIAAISAGKGYMLYYNSGWAALAAGTQNYVFGMGASSVPGYLWLLDTTGTLGTSDSVIPSQKAVKTYADTKLAGPGVVTSGYVALWQGTTGLSVGSGVLLDTGSVSTNSDTVIPSQKAVKTYADTKLVGPGATTTEDYIPLWTNTTGLALKEGLATSGTGNLVRATTPTITTPVINFGAGSHDYAAGVTDWTLSGAELSNIYFKLTNASGGVNMIPPDAAGHIVLIWNSTGQTVTIKKTGGTGETVANGKKAVLIHSGTDYINALGDQ